MKRLWFFGLVFLFAGFVTAAGILESDSGMIQLVPANGEVIVNGSLSADYFLGDGSQLSGTRWLDSDTWPGYSEPEGNGVYMDNKRLRLSQHPSYNTSIRASGPYIKLEVDGQYPSKYISNYYHQFATYTIPGRMYLFTNDVGETHLEQYQIFFRPNGDSDKEIWLVFGNDDGYLGGLTLGADQAVDKQFIPGSHKEYNLGNNNRAWDGCYCDDFINKPRDLVSLKKHNKEDFKVKTRDADGKPIKSNSVGDLASMTYAGELLIEYDSYTDLLKDIPYDEETGETDFKRIPLPLRDKEFNDDTLSTYAFLMANRNAILELEEQGECGDLRENVEDLEDTVRKLERKIRRMEGRDREAVTSTTLEPVTPSTIQDPFIEEPAFKEPELAPTTEEA